MINAYHNVWHVTEPDGRVISHHETNDDNDDGVPDGEVMRFSVGPQARERALQSPYNRSHIGASGVRVYVYLDGKEVM